MDKNQNKNQINNNPVNSVNKEKTKFNKTWIFVGILVIFTGIILIVSLTAKNTLMPNPSKSEKVDDDVAHTSLEFAENARPGATPGTWDIDINVDSNGDKITLTQLEMSYDPKSLNILDINPGTFIDKPTILQKSIDTQNGKIKYWIGIPPNQKGIIGKGTIATITFQKTGTGGADISFLPKTSVTASGLDESVLKNMTSGYIDNLPTTQPLAPISPIPTIIK